MFKRFLFLVLFISIIFSCTEVFAGSSMQVSNNYFSVVMPKDTKGTYSVSKEDNGIYIYEKISAKEGTGGFAFCIKIYKAPKDYATLEDTKKIGELVAKNGVTYDMVLIQPREIYYGEGEKIAKNYSRLYDYAPNAEIKGVNGNKYIKEQGTKGENIYKETLKEYKDKVNNKRQLSKIGYAYFDLNSDGIDELFIGEISKKASNSEVYDVYTMVDRKPSHVAGADETNRYFVCDDIYLYEKSTEAKKAVDKVLTLDRNSTKLRSVMGLMYSTENKKKMYYISNGNTGNWEKVSKKSYNERKMLFSDYKKFDFVPLSKIK